MSSDIALQNALSQQQVASGSSANNPDQAAVGLAEDFDDFLSLLTTQLQNQDPTEPMSTEEFTNQLVQFSQVEQQINSNQKLDDLIALQNQDPLQTATGFVGLRASFDGRKFFYDGDNPSRLSYSLNNPSEQTEITVLDQFGGEVYSTDGRTGAGAHEFIWDGTDNAGNPVEPGTYQIDVRAQTEDGDPVTTATLVSGRVRGIESDGQQTFLLVGERAIPQSQILRIEEPAKLPANEDEATL